MKANIGGDARYTGRRQRFARDVAHLLHCSIPGPQRAPCHRCSPHRAGQLADPSASR
ncbi:MULTISPECIES: hypothetical protein [Stenotrophomonas]|uniref:hypothetical protein n=1 Tax=Stenotrophomonas TaxID=40323 RepID=UPI0015FB56F9|nr:hypothetical protein [Stenotrophomonas lacuserhaii]